MWARDHVFVFHIIVFISKNGIVRQLFLLFTHPKFGD